MWDDLQSDDCFAIEFPEAVTVIGLIAHNQCISTCECDVVVCMAKDPVGDLIGTFPIFELLERVAAETVAVQTLLKSWVVRLFESWCVVGNYHDATVRLSSRNLFQGLLKPLHVSLVLCVVVCNGPALDLRKVVRQVSSLRYERV